MNNVIKLRKPQAFDSRQAIMDKLRAELYASYPSDYATLARKAEVSTGDHLRDPLRPDSMASTEDDVRPLQRAWPGAET